MHRLFVALRPPAPLRQRLAELMHGVIGARWQSDDQLHVTLCYIGEVDRHVAEDVATALGNIDSRAVTLALDGVGRFDHKGRIEAIWAGVGPKEPLAALHRKIDRALVTAGLRPEARAYLPHVTLARFSRGGGGAVVDGFLAAHAGLSSEAFPVDSFDLYESELGRDGSVYHLVERYPLR